MPDLPPGFLADLLRLVAFIAAVGALTVLARQGLTRGLRRRGADALSGFLASAPGTFLLVILSFLLCLLAYLALF